MRKQLVTGWAVTDEHPDSECDELVCFGPFGERHTLEGAIGKGMLSEIRKARGHTQQEVADQICVSVHTVARWENGQTATVRVPLRKALTRYVLRYDLY